MRIRTEQRDPGDASGEDEVVIRYTVYDESVARLEAAVRDALSEEKRIVLFRDSAEFYFPAKEILFFETDGRKVVAHTARDLYYCKDKLLTLEQILPRYFIRSSKSGIVNGAAVFSVRRGLTGVSEVGFRGTTKTAYVSRSYYKSFMDYLNESKGGSTYEQQ